MEVPENPEAALVWMSKMREVIRSGDSDALQDLVGRVSSPPECSGNAEDARLNSVLSHCLGLCVMCLAMHLV
jgi:hypothetical protein